MLRSVTLVACLAALPALAVSPWPDQIGTFKKTSSGPLTITDRPLWAEYGLISAEQAEYSDGAAKWQGQSYQMKDPTGSFAAFEWQRPAGSKPSKLAEVAATTPDGVIFVYANYVFRFTGWTPKEAADVEPLTAQITNPDYSSLPPLRNYLPAAGLEANSERYILGPDSLARFAPGLPPGTVAFSMGAEGLAGQYGPVRMTVFAYPNPQIAIQRLAEFQKVPGAAARRSGVLVSVIMKPPDADVAERLLAQVKYEATITLNERIPTRRDNIGDLIVNVFILIGILIGAFVVLGLAFGFLKRWLGWGTSDETLVVLHLHDR